jgi:DNA-binding winged helix-turn-helix (wHTH) protein
VPTPGRTLVYACEQSEIDLSRRELRAGGVPVPISGRAFDILEAIVRGDGKVVTKDDLMHRVWAGAIVEENTLQVYIAAVRKALGSDRGLLKTVSGRGYQMVGNWSARSAIASDSVDVREVPRHASGLRR